MDISLTPAEIKEAENIFPGENWFCYWRTSAALWETKLASLRTNGTPVFIPLYWGFHSENAETFDFGEQRPEGDLARLHRALLNTGCDAVWLLPLTPVPFMPNGGLPSFIARHPSHDAHGMTQAFLDTDGSIHKTHSFYDPRVYQAFRKWVWQLGQVLTQKSVATPLKGLRAYWVGPQEAHSYLEDYSPTFEAGFTRYLKQQKLPVRMNDDGVEMPGMAPHEASVHVARYRKLISDLYSQTASESLAGHWTGVQEYGFLGGAPQDIFPRSSDIWNHKIELMQDIWTQLEWSLLPSSVLIPNSVKKGVIAKFLKDHLSPTLIRQTVQQHLAQENDSGNFVPLVFFDFFWDDDMAIDAPKKLEELGLLAHVKRDFQGCWRWRGRFDYEREADEGASERLKFFFGHQIDKQRFQHILRLFMNGQRILLDRAGLDPVLEKKLQIFILENELKTQEINFLTSISLIKLGEGMLLIYNSQTLMAQPMAKKILFWENVTKYLALKHLAIKGDEPLFYTWKTRSTSTNELNYESVRRISIYNPTPNRQRVQVIGSKRFAFLKVVDPIQAQAKSTPMGVEIEVMAQGSISLDFGHFEE
ncbi:MAG: hypothetical protein ACLGG7_02585 [Bacteriovoracia bacterium]